LRDRINRTYFLLMILRENERLNRASLATLEDKLRSVSSGVKNGVFSPVSGQILLAEQLKLHQKLIEIQSDQESAIEILSFLTGLGKEKIDKIRSPGIESIPATDLASRPEMELFDLQMNKVELARRVTAVKNNPRVFAFGQVGYGKPGLNMLSDTWDSFWILGAGLKWNIWDWHINQREQKMVSLQKDMVQNQKESFDLNLRIQVANEQSSVRKYSAAVEQDLKLLRLREDILKTISSQFDNGIVSSSDYVQELNARLMAEIALATDRLLLLQAENNLLTILGKN
jgi:outer membrane protein TolC